MFNEVFVQISIILIIAIFVSVLMKLLRQPMMIGYIITGIVVSPYFLNLVNSSEASPISTFAEFGVTLLLFMVGLNLNPNVIKQFGKVSLISGVAQVFITSIFGYIIMKLLGFDVLTSLYVSVALTFSSTIIIMKLLSDKGELETLHGKISIGFLIVQDLISIFLLIIVSAFSSKSSGGFLSIAIETTLKGVGLLILMYVISVYTLPKIIEYIAKFQEFLFLFAIGWAFAISTLFYYTGFSMEIGALLAGISMSASSYRYEISSRLKPLRDFFIIIFFILLGSQMVFSNFSKYIIPIIVLSIFVLLIQPIILIAIMGMLGYTKRNSFLIGLIAAQVSEFSFILLSLGITVGHLSTETLSLVTVVGLITMAGSSYFINYGEKIYLYLSLFLSIFEKKGIKIDEHTLLQQKKYDIILFGHNRLGYDILEALKKLKKNYLVIDYNPETVASLTKNNVSCVYGDASDPEFLDDLDMKKVKMIISTVPDFETNRLLISDLRCHNKKTISIVVSHQIDEALKLYELGATYVIMPHFLGGHHTSTMIQEYGLDVRKFIKEKIAHVKHLEKRKKIGHEHPVHERA